MRLDMCYFPSVREDNRFCSGTGFFNALNGTACYAEYFVDSVKNILKSNRLLFDEILCEL